MKYIALLRGINVGGNNKVPMLELKACFEQLGFSDVITYINSGNVIFESQEPDKVALVSTCEAAIEKQFGFHVICAIISAKELRTALEHAPAWWGDDNKELKHNAMFVIAPKTAKEVMDEVGEPKLEYEKVAAYGPIIFWTATFKTYSRTRYKDIVGMKTYKSVTIRNSNTARKLAILSS